MLAEPASRGSSHRPSLQSAARPIRRSSPESSAVVVSPSLDTLSRLAKGLGLRPVLRFERTTEAPHLASECQGWSGCQASCLDTAPPSKPARPEGAAASQKAPRDSGTSTKRKRAM
jgi:hypothetical protein